VSGRHRAGGQAMAETLVAGTVLAMLMLALPAIASLQDVQRTGLRAAVNASFLSGWNAQRAVAGDLRTVAGRDLAAMPWAHPANGSPLVEVPGSLDVSTQEGTPPGSTEGAFSFITGPLREAGSYLGAAFDLSPLGFHRAEVKVRVPPMRGAPDPFSALELQLEGHAFLLADAWNAADSAQVRDRVGGLVPSAMLKDVSEPVRALSGLLSFVEPAFDRFCPGLIEAEPVPASRLAGARARVRRGVEDPPPSLERPECR
jgi:hypothetical protein